MGCRQAKQLNTLPRITKFFLNVEPRVINPLDWKIPLWLSYNALTKGIRIKIYFPIQMYYVSNAGEEGKIKRLSKQQWLAFS